MHLDYSVENAHILLFHLSIAMVSFGVMVYFLAKAYREYKKTKGE